MKKITVTMLSALLLSACQTVGEVQQASKKGVANAFSCDQIKSAFGAYKNDRDSLDAYMALAAMTNLSTKGVTADTVDKYYEKARNNANLALVLQGCEPL